VQKKKSGRGIRWGPTRLLLGGNLEPFLRWAGRFGKKKTGGRDWKQSRSSEGWGKTTGIVKLSPGVQGTGEGLWGGVRDAGILLGKTSHRRGPRAFSG